MTTPLSTRFSRNLSMVAFAPLALGVLLIAMGSAKAAPAHDTGEATIILHHVDRHPATAKAARQLYRRLDGAALEACGGGSFSLVELNRAVRQSACWRTAMNGALAQIRTPYLPLAVGEGIPLQP